MMKCSKCGRIIDEKRMETDKGVIVWPDNTGGYYRIDCCRILDFNKQCKGIFEKVEDGEK